MNRGRETTHAGSGASKERKKRQPPSHRSRSPRKEKQRQGSSPRPRPRPRPLSFAIFVGNRPMTEADSIIRDLAVAVEFARQIFPPNVQQSMVGQQDFDVFQEGIHGAAKGLYTAYEIGMCLRAARREMEKMDERIRSSEARAEKAERELKELKKAKADESYAAGQSNPIVAERVTQRLLSHVIADRDTASMFAIENARSKGYEEGFHAGRKVGIEKTKEKLAEEVCRCENRGFKHGWIPAIQAAEALRAKDIHSAFLLFQHDHLPFSAYEVEKSNDEGDAA